MPEKSDRIPPWTGKTLKVRILSSMAGFSQHILIEKDTAAMLFDTGDGILRDLKSSGIDLNNIEALFYTHGHFDHMGGLYPLLGFMRMIGRKSDLHIFAPEGCAEVTGMAENFVSLYSTTTSFRIRQEKALPGEKYRFADITVLPFPVVHCGSIEGHPVMDPLPALGYKITCGDETVVISGDTGDCESLRENVRGADLAIIEATIRSSAEATDEQLKKVHLSEELATEIGKTANEFVLVHKGRR
jgi:ribonuclease BN (tRNA processing enzyme)